MSRISVHSEITLNNSKQYSTHTLWLPNWSSRNSAESPSSNDRLVIHPILIQRPFFADRRQTGRLDALSYGAFHLYLFLRANQALRIRWSVFILSRAHKLSANITRKRLTLPPQNFEAMKSRFPAKFRHFGCIQLAKLNFGRETEHPDQSLDFLLKVKKFRKFLYFFPILYQVSMN